MKIIKNSFRLDGSDKILKLPLININDNLGYDQDVSNLITSETNKNINTPIDSDLNIYTPYNNTQNELNFYFSLSGNQISSFIIVGFAEDDVKTDYGRRSFFIADTYTTYKIETQEKLCQNFINGIGGLTPSYIIQNKQFFSREFYQWYINDNIFTSGDTITGYTKFSFFNAKTGNIHVFYNSDNENMSSELKMYVPTVINKTNKTYQFQTSTLNLYELVNENYRAKIQRSLNTTPNKSPILPSGTTLYITTSGITYSN